MENKAEKPCGLQDVILTFGGMGRNGPCTFINRTILFDSNPRYVVHPHWNDWLTFWTSCLLSQWLSIMWHYRGIH